MAELTDEQKIQQLTAQVGTLTSEKTTLSGQNQKLTAEKASLADQVQKLTSEKATLVGQAKTLTDEKGKQATDLTQALQVITELKQQLADQASGIVKIPTLKIGNDEFEFLSEFHYKGNDVTLERLKEDAQLALELVKEGVGDLRKVAAPAGAAKKA